MSIRFVSYKISKTKLITTALLIINYDDKILLGILKIYSLRAICDKFIYKIRQLLITNYVNQITNYNRSGYDAGRGAVFNISLI